LIAAPWDWGRSVLTGAMAEHEELKTMKYRMVTIEQQLRDALTEANQANMELERQVLLMEDNLRQLQDSMNKELSKSYNKGLAKGGTWGFVLGIGLGILASN
jgi:predicted  nucleic acid-binding Zn-ribbon protein